MHKAIGEMVAFNKAVSAIAADESSHLKEAAMLLDSSDVLSRCPLMSALPGQTALRSPATSSAYGVYIWLTATQLGKRHNESLGSLSLTAHSTFIKNLLNCGQVRM